MEKQKQEIVIEKTTGRQVFTIEHDARTLVLDMDVISKATIGEFVKAIIHQYPNAKQLTPSDIAALAIGKFGVSLDDIYDGSVESLSKLDDRTLAQIFRLREEAKDANSN